MRRIPNRAVELEIMTAEEFWGSWVDQPVVTFFFRNRGATGTEPSPISTCMAVLLVFDVPIGRFLGGK